MFWCSPGYCSLILEVAWEVSPPTIILQDVLLPLSEAYLVSWDGIA